MKYLKFFIGVLMINFISLFYVSRVEAVVANIDRIVFTTEAQTVAPDTISKAFTIQTQNSNGALETIDETSDLSVSVNSATGQFNSNSTTWNPNTTFTMSKNTGNKNFYYKDSTEGTYTITATLTTRTTGKSWITTQEVIVGNVVIDPIDTIISTTTATTTPGSPSVSTSTTSGGTTVISTHYITETVSTYIEPTVFELSAGRARLGYVGAPLSFVAKYKLSSDLKGKKCKYIWNFGDGGLGDGEDVEHIYKYAGDYNLVLNGECSDQKAISRSTVKILEPNIFLLKNNDGSVEVTNNSKYEINLYNWGLLSGQQKYFFPQDTIINAGEKITFASEYTKIVGPGRTILVDATGRTVAVCGEMTIEELIDFITKLNILSS